MADTLNPIGLMPNADFRVNPMQGALAGFQLGNVQNLLDRSMRDSDQAYLSKQHDYNMALQEDPAKLAEFAVRAAKARNEQDIANNPLSVEAPVSKLQTSMSNDQTQQTENAAAQKLAQANWFVDSGQKLDTGEIDMSRGAQDPQNVANWQRMIKEAAKFGIKGFDPLPSQDQIDGIQRQRTAAENSLPQLQKLAQIKATSEGQVRAIREQGTVASGLETQKTGDELLVNSQKPGMADEAIRRKFVSGAPLKPEERIELTQSTGMKLAAALSSNPAMVMEAMKNPDQFGTLISKLVNQYMTPGGATQPAAPAAPAASAAPASKSSAVPPPTKIVNGQKYTLRDGDRGRGYYRDQ